MTLGPKAFFTWTKRMMGSPVRLVGSSRERVKSVLRRLVAGCDDIGVRWRRDAHPRPAARIASLPRFD